jgi:hypothetical protein
MNDDPETLSDRDPAKLLPFMRDLLPYDPSVEQLPSRRYNWHAEEPRGSAEPATGEE